MIYHGTQRLVLNKAAFLDARFKSLPFLKPEEKDDIATAIVEEIAYVTLVSGRPNDNTGNHNTYTTPKPKRRRGEHVLLEILSDVFTPTAGDDVLDESSDPTHLQASLEMKAYLKEETTEDCPLLWWKKNAFRYPLLSKMAQRYLCIPATSVPSERVFSAVGHIVNQKHDFQKMLRCWYFWPKTYDN